MAERKKRERNEGKEKTKEVWRGKGEINVVVVEARFGRWLKSCPLWYKLESQFVPIRIRQRGTDVPYT